MIAEENNMQLEWEGERHPLRFGKSGKLRHRTLVEGLFAGGRSLYDYPLRLVYRVLSAQELSDSFRDGCPPGVAPLQLMVTVPKKKRRHAVDRVLMRRPIREAFRLNRLPLTHAIDACGGGRYLQIAVIYLHGGNLPYAEIEEKMRGLLDKLVRKTCSCAQ